MSTVTKKVNYLNNKDILKEIHESKSSYCYYTDKEYNRYDFIVDMPQEDIIKSFEYACKPETIQQAREIRANRLGIDVSEVKNTDLVFRIMTWEHIPVSPKQPRKVVKKKTAKDILEFEEPDLEEIFADLEDPTTAGEVDDMVHVKVNFHHFP